MTNGEEGGAPRLENQRRNRPGQQLIQFAIMGTLLYGLRRLARGRSSETRQIAEPATEQKQFEVLATHVSPEESGAEKTWGDILQLAGAVAGLGALVYLVGAATLWVRFWAAQLPADVAVEHDTHEQVIALGLRGILFVLIAFLILGMIVRFLLRFGSRILSVVHLTVPTVPGCLVAPLVVLVSVVAAFTTWRIFGVVVGISIFFAILIPNLQHQLPGTPKFSAFEIAIMLAACGFTGFSWQITGHIPVQTVLVTPSLASLKGIAIPYFGEDSDQIYLGDLRITHQKLIYCSQIIEIPRKNVTLTFEAKPAYFDNRFASPAVTLFDLAREHSLQGNTKPMCTKSPQG